MESGEFDVWYEADHTGSMEVVGSEHMWQRSIAKYKLSYLVMEIP